MNNELQSFDVVERSQNNQVTLGDILEFLESKKMNNVEQSEHISETETHLDNNDSFISANKFHNLAVECAQQKQFNQALSICLKGLSRYPHDMDLMADAIKYSSEQGDFETAQLYFEELSRIIPKSNWNWRAYTFSIDYLMCNVLENKDVLEEIITDYCKYLPNEEKAIVAKSEFEDALGNYQVSLDILKQAISETSTAPQCALRLADKQLELGMYEDVVQTARYGMMASAESQPTINIPYLYFVKALAEDAILHRRAFRNEELDTAEIDIIHREYTTMLELFPVLTPYRSTIILRTKMLEMLRTEFFPKQQ